MEVEGHGQFAAIQRGILLAVRKGRGGHFAHGHQATGFKHIPAKLLQELMDARAVGVKTAPIAAVDVIGKILRFGNQINHIKPQTVHTAIGPERAHFF